MENNRNDHYLSPEEEIKKLYNDNVRKFVGKFIGYGKDNCLDAFHEAVQAVYCLIKEGRRTKAQGEIENANALLFRIGRNKLVDIARKNDQQQRRIADLQQEITPDDGKMDTDLFYSSERIERIRAGFRELGKKCQQIISLNYYEGYDLNEIVEIMDYSSYDAAKQRLSVCLKNLKNLVFGAEQTNT